MDSRPFQPSFWNVRGTSPEALQCLFNSESRAGSSAEARLLVSFATSAARAVGGGAATTAIQVAKPLMRVHSTRSPQSDLCACSNSQEALCKQPCSTKASASP